MVRISVLNDCFKTIYNAEKMVSSDPVFEVLTLSYNLGYLSTSRP